MLKSVAADLRIVMSRLDFGRRELSGAFGDIGTDLPPVVVRGIQVGLGVKLGTIAYGRYVPAEGGPGFYLAAACELLLAGLLLRPRFPAAVAVLLLGTGWALWHGTNPLGGTAAMPPAAGLPSREALWTGLVLLALPQVPLSLGNSVLATRDLADDWFPGRGVTLRRIGTTYSLFNAVVGVVGGIPVCQGFGGMAGHYAMGGRTGGRSCTTASSIWPWRRSRPSGWAT
ncbi:hypothetical protein CO151_06150 [bacterium CG_4_9_14_3_um_filter_65_15]|nr:MAG: hypothetical protein CO151_06150 [bacterium CG_4_9_14_3_um_filter_65_15]